MNNKKQKIIIILHLIASFASLLLFALGIIFYYTLPTKIPTNILFVVGLLFVATILISSLLCLPLKIKIRKQILFAIFCIIFRYIWIIIPFVSIAFINLIPIDDNIFMFTDAFEIISSFIPMVFTIIVVTLSRMNDKVCGIDSHDFRRLRKDIHFSLVEMILIGIALFTIGTIFRLISSFKLSISS